MNEIQRIAYRSGGRKGEWTVVKLNVVIHDRNISTENINIKHDLYETRKPSYRCQTRAKSLPKIAPI